MASRPGRRRETPGARVPASRTSTSGQAAARPPARLALGGAPPPGLRAVLTRWALAGAGSGAVIGLLRAPFPWSGQGIAMNLGSIAGYVLIVTLLALGAAWVWQRQQAS